MKRGDVRWYTFEPPDKRRPVLILTRDSAIGVLNTVTVAPITSTMRGIPTEVFLDRSDGMPSDCAVNLDHIQTISKNKVGALLATLPNYRMAEVQRAVDFALGFDEVSA
jgi:mRNA interferase MazF